MDAGAAGADRGREKARHGVDRGTFGGDDGCQREGHVVLVSVLRDFLRRFGGKNAACSRHQRGMTRSHTDLIDAEWLVDDERVDVSAWRLRRLLESNFAPSLAI